MAVARTGNVEAATLLLDAGADVNAIELWGQQIALMWAAAQKQPAMIKLLIARGADVDARGAVRNWERKVIKEPRPKDMNQGGFTPLLYAAREGCIECAKELVAGGADLDLPDPHRVTPLDHGAHEPALRFRRVSDRGRRRHQQVGSLRPLAAVHGGGYEHDARAGQRLDGRVAEHGQADGDRRRAPVAREGCERQRAAEAPAAVPQRAAGSRRRLDSLEGATPLLRAARAGDTPMVESAARARRARRSAEQSGRHAADGCRRRRVRFARHARPQSHRRRRADDDACAARCRRRHRRADADRAARRVGCAPARDRAAL